MYSLQHHLLSSRIFSRVFFIFLLHIHISQLFVYCNKDNAISSSSATSSLVPPAVEPFLFPNDLVAGRRAGTACIVSAGDLPIKIKWLKDGQPLDDSLGATIITTDFASILSFPRVSRPHNGNYTCMAQNPASTAAASASMLVQEPPTWTLEPKDRAVILGHSVTFDAKAEAFPEPIIRWKRSFDGENFKVIISNANIQTLENGSLTIREVTREDGGHYMVQAINGVGPGISHVVKLTVKVGAHFEKKFESHAIKKGDGIRLRCKALGEKPVSVSWSKDRLPISSNTEPRYIFEEDMSEEYTESIIGIPSSDRRDSALFTCFAHNEFGEDSKNFQLLVQEPPDCPADLKPSEIESRSFTISWNHPYTGNSPLTNYLIEYKQQQPEGTSTSSSGSEGKVFKQMIESKFTSYTIQGLQPHSVYGVRIYARNPMGISEDCSGIKVNTEIEAPSSPPRDLKAVAQSSTSLLVSWKPPSTEHFVTGYYVGYRLLGLPEPFAYKTVEALNKGNRLEEHCILTGLRRHTRYEVIVQAFNGKGAGPPSDHVDSQTLEFDPPQAPQLQIKGTSTSSLLVSWDERDTNPVTGFYLFHKSEVSEWEEISLPARSSEYNLTNLSCGRRYHLYLVAFNDAGRGAPSAFLSAKTDGSPPMAPSNRELIQSNSTFVLVNLNSWKSGGCPILSFIVQYKPRSQREFILLSNHVLPEAGNLIITDLVPAKWYTLFLTATNDAGSTEAEYSFSTLTLSGDLIPAYPLGSLEEFATQVRLVMPIACVLVVIILLMTVMFVLRRKRRDFISTHHSNYADSMSTCEAIKGCELLPLNDYDTKSRTSLAFCSEDDNRGHTHLTPAVQSSRGAGVASSSASYADGSRSEQQIYFPSPYALSRVVSVYESNDPSTLSKSCSPRQQLNHSSSSSHHPQHQQNHGHNHRNSQPQQHYDVPFKTQCHGVSEAEANLLSNNHSIVTFNQRLDEPSDDKGTHHHHHDKEISHKHYERLYYNVNCSPVPHQGEHDLEDQDGTTRDDRDSICTSRSRTQFISSSPKRKSQEPLTFYTQTLHTDKHKEVTHSSGPFMHDDEFQNDQILSEADYLMVLELE